MSYAVAYRSNRPYDEQAYDGILAGVIATIVLLGLVMVFSSGISGSIGQFELRFTHLFKHGIHILVGLGFMLLTMYVKLDKLQANSKLLLLGGMLVLAALMLPGFGLEINGSTRWFRWRAFACNPPKL